VQDNKQPQKDLTELTNEEIYEYGTMLEAVTPLENELLRRLEYYIQTYGDYLGSYNQEDIL
jgi:succinylglutamate desuccinylase